MEGLIILFFLIVIIALAKLIKENNKSNSPKVSSSTAISSAQKAEDKNEDLIKECLAGNAKACLELSYRADYPKEELRYLRRAIENGSSIAARILAYKHSTSEFEKIDLLIKSADLGNADSITDILFSDEIIHSPERFEYILKLAESGNEKAMPVVAKYYNEGGCVLKSITESARWTLRSAEHGNKASQIEISDHYFTGFGVSENAIEGMAWLYVAEFNSGDSYNEINSRRSSEKAADIIKQIEKKIPNHVLQLAQERAKVILGLITDGKSTVDSVAQGNGPAVVKNTTKPKTKPKGSGTGSIVSSNGYIVTAAHVLNGASYIEIVTPTGTFPANTESVDAANDVAILKIDTTCKDFVEVLHSRDVRLGQSVSTIGFPNVGIQGHSPKVTQGVISSDNGAQNDIRMWQISAPIQPGNSGGPLLDESGNLIGVVVASLSLKVIEATGAVPQNVNYAVKSAYLEPLLNSHKLTIKQNKENVSQKFEDLVESTKKSIVLVIIY
jgi:S1-C subfamily serine protease